MPDCLDEAAAACICGRFLVEWATVKSIKGNMPNVMTRSEVREYDRRAIEEIGASGVVLMENAGRGCADIISGMYKGGGCVVIFCGPGNNGGDGYVIARHLSLRDIPSRVVVLAERGKITGDADINLRIIEKIALDVRFVAPNDTAKLTAAIEGASLIADAIFGTGLSGRVRDTYLPAITAINDADCPVFAVDIPSGLDCDTGEPLGDAVKADITATFVAIKRGFQNPASKAYTGKVEVVDIGI